VHEGQLLFLPQRLQAGERRMQAKVAVQVDRSGIGARRCQADRRAQAQVVFVADRRHHVQPVHGAAQHHDHQLAPGGVVRGGSPCPASQRHDQAGAGQRVQEVSSFHLVLPVSAA
jgi:hypothetical protein